MIEFSDAHIDELIIHKVGNRSLDERLHLSDSHVNISDDGLEQVIRSYFLSSFKDEVYYSLQHESQLELNEVFTFCKQIFEGEDNFISESQKLARHLFDVSNHPRIKGGEFYVALIRNVWYHNEELDVIGLFKSENKDVFLSVYPENKNYQVKSQEGIDIKKLDKGCLIFNTHSDEGYVLSIVDNTNKGEEAKYWLEDFLKVRTRENEYYYTQNYMRMCKAFVEDVYNEENQISRADQIDLLNSATSYFKDHEKFEERDFEKQVIEVPENIQAFQDFKRNFEDEQQLKVIDQFDISEQAFKRNKRVMKSVLKLDKNFHIYIHGDRSMIERGFDEENGLNYYTLYFEKES